MWQIHLTYLTWVHIKKRDFEVSLRFAFFHFREVLLRAVKLFEFKFYKVIFVAFSVLEIKSQKQNLYPIFLEFWQCVYNSIHTILSQRGETNFQRSAIELFRNVQRFPMTPKKSNSCQLMQVVIDQEETFSSHCEWEKLITGDDFRNDSTDRMGHVISIYHSNINKPIILQIISTEADLPKPHDKGWFPHWSLDLSPESSAPCIHTYLCIWQFSQLSLYSWDPSFAPERWPCLA